MENRSVDRIGPSIAPLLQSPMLQGAVRPNVQCSISPGREAPFRSEIVSDQDLGDLHGIQGSAFAQVVGHNPEIETVGN